MGLPIVCANAVSGPNPELITPAAPTKKRLFLRKSLRSLPLCMCLSSFTDCELERLEPITHRWKLASENPSAIGSGIESLLVQAAHERFERAPIALKPELDRVRC